MEYKNIFRARFVERPNRFIAYCELAGEKIKAHVRNTGRLRELLMPGAVVYLEKSSDGNRKTGYSLIAVGKGDQIVNIDSTAPNKVMKEALETNQCLLPGMGSLDLIKPETRFGESRFDFYLESGEQEAFVEVKCVTLLENSVALFPDAPTERGLSHVEELVKAKSQGFEAYLVFIVQMGGASCFSPHTRMHPEFSDMLVKAEMMGVHVLCYDCIVTEETIELKDIVPVQLIK